MRNDNEGFADFLHSSVGLRALGDERRKSNAWSPERSNNACRVWERGPASVPPALPRQSELGMAIEASASMLDLEPDWDGDDARRIAPETFKRMKEFLLDVEGSASREYERPVLSPRISPCPDGSIDCHWKCHHFELLLNVPEGLENDITCYGDDKAGFTIRGATSVLAGGGLLVAWLTRPTGQ